jgi:DNA polymerase-3 subunit gamma/tau
MRYASIMRLPLEMALVKLTQKESLLSLEDLISRLEKLEAKEIPLPEKETSERLEPLPKAQQETQAPQGEAAYSLAQEKEGMVSFEKLQSLWSELIRVIKSQKMSTGSYLEEGQPENLKGELVTIAFPKTSAFHKEYLESKSNKDLIEKEYTKLAKKSLRVNFILKEGMKIPKPQAAQEAQPEKSSESADPLIREALDMFGGKIVRQE